MPVTKTLVLTQRTANSAPQWYTNYCTKQDEWVKANYTVNLMFAPEGSWEKFAELSGVKVEIRTTPMKHSLKLHVKFIWEDAAAKTMFMLRFS